MHDTVIVFSLCYLASHYGLGLLSGEKTEQILLHVETRRDELANLIHNTKP